MKTKEELKQLKTELESLGKKLAELTDEELVQVTGGEHNMPQKNPDEKYVMGDFTVPQNANQYEFHFYRVPKNTQE